MITSKDKEIVIYIPGQPIAKGRPRFVRRGNYVSTYTPSKTKSYEDLIKVISGYVMQGKKLFDQAILIDMIVEFQIPDSWAKKKKEQAILGILKHTTRPDIDNVAKSIIDGLIGTVMEDDCLIAKMSITKKYSNNPGVHLSISEY